MHPVFWQAIRDSDYVIPDGYNVKDLTSELVGYLGSPDPTLRETYAYSIISYWIERGLYTSQQLREMTMLMVSNLGIGLKEKESDDVFLRSYSVLLLAEIIARDNQHNFLTEAEVKNLMRWTLEYMLTERDLRGFVRRKGWATCIGHTADLLRRLARNRYVDRNDLEQMMNAIAQRVTTPTQYVFIHNEDEGLVMAVWAALARQELTMPFMINWLARLVQVMHLVRPDDPFDPRVHGAVQNTRNFLRSFYFRIALNKKTDEWLNRLRPKVLAAVKAVNG
jgi:hypothetical protein